MQRGNFWSVPETSRDDDRTAAARCLNVLCKIKAGGNSTNLLNLHIYQEAKGLFSKKYMQHNPRCGSAHLSFIRLCPCILNTYMSLSLVVNVFLKPQRWMGLKRWRQRWKWSLMFDNSQSFSCFSNFVILILIELITVKPKSFKLLRICLPITVSNNQAWMFGVFVSLLCKNLIEML